MTTMVSTALRPVFVWALLVAVTLLSYGSWLDPTWTSPRLSSSFVVAIAGFKAWLIAMRYMELGQAIWPLKFVFNIWVVAVVTILIAMFWQN